MKVILNTPNVEKVVDFDMDVSYVTVTNYGVMPIYIKNNETVSIGNGEVIPGGVSRGFDFSNNRCRYLHLVSSEAKVIEINFNTSEREGSSSGGTYVHPSNHPISMITGLVDSYTAGIGGINAGQVVFVTTTNTVQAANSSNVTHAGRVVGIASATTAESDTVRVQKAGSIICPVWNLTPGNIYYLGAGGDIASTPPTTGFVQKIGVAETSTKLVIQIEPAILLN